MLNPLGGSLPPGVSIRGGPSLIGDRIGSFTVQTRRPSLVGPRSGRTASYKPSAELEYRERV